MVNSVSCYVSTRAMPPQPSSRLRNIVLLRKELAVRVFLLQTVCCNFFWDKLAVEGWPRALRAAPKFEFIKVENVMVIVALFLKSIYY